MTVDLAAALALSTRQMGEIRELFAEPLAARFDRTTEQVIGGLRAGDFPLGQEVRVEHPDGSSMRLQNAFALHDPETELVGIFSEHMGYYLFRLLGGDLKVTTLRDGVVVDTIEG